MTLLEAEANGNESDGRRLLAVVYNPIAYDGRVQRECEALSQIADVELLCPRGPEVPRGLPFQVRTVRLPSGLAGPVARHLKFASALISRALRTRPEILHAHDFFMAAPGAIAAKLCGAQFIYDAHELIIPEPDRPRGQRMAYWYRLEAWAIKRAQLVIAANDERSKLMREHYRLRLSPLTVRNIPPPFSSDYVTHGDPRMKYLPGVSKEERVCVYQGDVNLKRGLGRIIDVARFLPRNVRILIVGGGPDEQTVREQVQCLGLEDRVTLTGRVDRNELHEILAACDVGLITYPFEGLNNIYCASNKVFEYAQAGLPLVSTEQPPLADIVHAYEIGLTFGRFETPELIAEKIVQVIDNRTHYIWGLQRLLNDNTWATEAERLRKSVSALLVR